MMLAYTMDENDVKSIRDDSSQLLSTTLNFIKESIEVRHQTNPGENVNREHIDRNIIQLVETLKGLAQHEQIRNEILQQKTISILIEYYQKLKGLSKQLLLECLWTLSFNEQIAQQLRKHSQFILTLENIPKSDGDNTQQNVIRRTNSYSSRRSSTATVIDEVADDGIRKVADGVLWKLVKEPQFREKKAATDKRSFKYDMMISYCYADRQIVYKIQQFLTNEGFNIWFDRNNIHEQAMEIVADAIENSEFVIVCMSDSYKRDNHCQAETEYALNSKRLLLPLVVRKGYKPDGWLSSIASNNTYIDFGATHFKAASSLLMKKIKQQRKKVVLDVESKSSTPATSVHTPSVQQAVSSKPYVPSGSSTSIGTTNSASVAVSGQPQQQQMLTHSVSRSPTPGTDHSTTSIVVDRQQQQLQMPARPVSRSPTPGIDHSTASVIVDRQQQQASVHHDSQLSTHDSIFSSGSTVVVEQQHEAPTHPVSRPSTPCILPPAAPTIVDKQPQQQILAQAISRPPTPGSITSVAPINIDNQQQQTSVHTISRPPTPDAIHSNTSAIDVEQQQTQTPAQPALQRPTYSTVLPAPPFIGDKQHQQINMHRTQRSPTPSSISSDASINIGKHQQQTLVQPVLRPGITGNEPPTVSTTAVQQQQIQIPVQPALQRPTYSTVLSAPPFIGDKQHQQINMHRTQRSPTPSSISSDASINIGKHQQQTLVQPVLRPGITGNEPPTVSTTAVQQQQIQIPVQPALQRPTYSTVLSAPPFIGDKQHQQINMHRTQRSPTPSSISSDASINIGKHQQQTLVQPVLRPGITGNEPPTVSTTAVQQQQTQTPAQPALQRPTYSTVLSAPPFISDKQQQQINMHRTQRSPTPSSISFDASINIGKHQQQTLVQPVLRPGITGNGPPTVSTTAVQQQQTQTPAQPALQRPTYSTVLSAPPFISDKQQQQINMHRTQRSPTPSSISSDASINIGKHQQQTLVQPVQRQGIINNGPPTVSTTSVQQQQMQTPVQPVLQRPTYSTVLPAPPSIDNKQHQQQTSVQPILRPGINSNGPSTVSTTTVQQQQTQAPMQPGLQRSPYSTVSPDTPFIVGNQQQQINGHRALRSPTPSSISSDASINIGKQQTSIHSPSRFITSNHDDSLQFVKVNTQQQNISVHPISQPLTNGSVSFNIAIDIDKQQQQRIPAQSNSRPTTPSIPQDVASRNPVLSAPALANVSDISRLPQEYTNYNTGNSTYHTIPINAWRKNDVLDFLFDSNLNAMMPLCESMAGKAFIRLFRMCQEKPSRLYSQLNEELRVRLNGLTLPMGIYTQFLTEMDALVGPTLETHPAISPLMTNMVQRVVITPRTAQQQQPSPTRSTTSTSPLKTITPIEATMGTTPHNTRVVERAVFRPSSTVDRPYNFIVESVEESTDLLQRVGRYGPQFLSLDETARQHREINSFR